MSRSVRKPARRSAKARVPEAREPDLAGEVWGYLSAAGLTTRDIVKEPFDPETEPSECIGAERCKADEGDDK